MICCWTALLSVGQRAMSNCSCGSRGGLKVQSAALSAEPESGTSRFPRETTQLFDSPRGYFATWQGFAPGSKWLQNGPVFPGFFIALRRLLHYLAYWCGNLLLRFLLNPQRLPHNDHQ